MTKYLNDPFAPSTTRTPRVRVLANGVEVPGVVSAEITQTNAYQADAFRACFAMAAAPNFGPAWWADQAEILMDVQIQIGGEWVSLIIGQVEPVSVHLETNTVDVDGHDLSMRLIEAKTQESFPNKTASEIATLLAQRHGLTPDVTATTTLAGRFYATDHTAETSGQFSRVTTEWDLLTALARFELFDLYVTGTTLHFHPQVKPDATPWGIVWTPGTADQPDPVCNVSDLRIERSLTLAGGVEVVVQSWNSKKGKAFKRVAKTLGTKSASAATQSHTQRFVRIIPNLTEAEAQSRANEILAEISKNEKTVTFSAPGDLTLTPFVMASLESTGTAWDHVYYVDSVTRSLSFDEGFVMHGRLKSHDPRMQVSFGDPDLPLQTSYPAQSKSSADAATSDAVTINQMVKQYYLDRTVADVKTGLGY